MTRAGPREADVLQAVRLAGCAESSAIAERIDRPSAEIEPVLDRAAQGGHLERLAIADVGGWILTEAGHARLARLLADELDATGARPQLTAAASEFEPLNARFLELVGSWQLRSTSPTSGTPDPEHRAEFAALLDGLDELAAGLAQLITPVASRLPRFDRYPRQLRAAVSRARREGLGWVTGVGILSCHTVWAELHQDLLSTLGIDRTARREDGP